jgi:hypothetical protein
LNVFCSGPANGEVGIDAVGASRRKIRIDRFLLTIDLLFPKLLSGLLKKRLRPQTTFCKPDFLDGEWETWPLYLQSTVPLREQGDHVRIWLDLSTVTKVWRCAIQAVADTSAFPQDELYHACCS